MRETFKLRGCVHAGQFEGYTGPCGQSRGGVRIGVLPTLEHGVSGVLWLEHPGRFCIENFNYDGQGPGKKYISS